jgi:hypothetical protein
MAKKLEPLIYCGRSEIYGQIENELEHIVYDLSIEDLDERKRKAQVFENAVRVAEFLKVKVDVVFKNRVAPKRIKGVDGRNYAVRVLNKNQK